MLRSATTGLVQSGIEVHVATTDDHGPGRLAVPLGVPVVEAGVVYWHFPRQTRFYSASLPLARWLATRVGEFDVVHIHSLFSFAPVPAALCAGLRRVPYLVRPFGVLGRWGLENRRARLKRASMFFVERPIVAGARLLHFMSEREQREARDAGFDGPSIVLPFGIDLRPFEDLPSASDLRASMPSLAGRLVLLFMGRIDPIKGLELLIPAFARARSEGARVALVIAGDGDPTLVTALKRRADALGVSDGIHWAGFVRGEEKRRLLAGADILIQPSWSENFGLAVAEGMACGLPVIVTDTVGVSSDVARADAGRVVPCNVEQISAAIKELSADEAARLRMGANARTLIRSEFTLDVTTRKLVQVYNRLALQG